MQPIKVYVFYAKNPQKFNIETQKILVGRQAFPFGKENFEGLC